MDLGFSANPDPDLKTRILIRPFFALIYSKVQTKIFTNLLGFKLSLMFFRPSLLSFLSEEWALNDVL